MKKIWAILVVAFLLTGCIKVPVTIEQTEAGYHLEDHLDADRDQVIDGLERIGLTPQRMSGGDMTGVLKEAYGPMSEEKFGLQYTLYLIFGAEKNANSYTFCSFDERIEFDHWPKPEEQQMIQKAFDELVRLYGKPVQTTRIPDEKNIFEDEWKMSKSAKPDSMPVKTN